MISRRLAALTIILAFLCPPAHAQVLSLVRKSLGRLRRVIVCDSLDEMLTEPTIASEHVR